MFQTTLWILVTIAGAVAISYLAAIALFGYMRSQNTNTDVEYVWLIFRRTMVVSGTMVGSIYGFTQAREIIDAVARVLHG